WSAATAPPEEFWASSAAGESRASTTTGQMPRWLIGGIPGEDGTGDAAGIWWSGSQVSPLDLGDHGVVRVHDVGHRALAHLAQQGFALAGVAVAEVEVGAVVKDGEKDGGALAHLGRVHVAAEVAGPAAGQGFLASWRHRNPAQHRLEVDRHPFDAAVRHLGGAGHPDGV